MLKKRIWLIGTLMTALAGCGGGGSSSTSGSGALTLSGTAATGAAIANATIDVKCAAGTGSAITGTDGTFTVTINGGALPCMLRVTQASKTELHSVTEGAQTTVNITPISEMMVARIAGETPKTFFDNFDASKDASKVTANTVADAKQIVVNTLKGAGVDLAGSDPLHDILKAANGGNAGDDFDKKLDALQSKLALAQTSIDTLAQALADNKDASGDGASAVATTLLQPAASTCAAMHSGTYRVVAPANTDPAWQTYVGDFDATALTLSDHGTTNTGSAVPNAPCEFQSSSGNTRFLFAQSGMVVAHHSTSGWPDRVSFAFPEQPLTLSDLQGTWNQASFLFDSTKKQFVFSHAIATIATDGSTKMADCKQITTTQADCAAAVADGSFALASGGGFTYTPLAVASVARKAFAYRAPNGNMALVLLQPNNTGWTIATKQMPRVLPNVGDKARYWYMTINSSDVPSTLFKEATTISAVDAATDSFTRVFDDINQTDTFIINKPYTGLSYRTGGTVTVNNVVKSVVPIVSLKLQGMGITVYGKPVTDVSSFFGVRVDKP